MESKNKKEDKIDYAHSLKETCKKVLKAIRPVVVRVGKMSFWAMALMCCLLRLFVVYPLGSLLAIAGGCTWLYQNFNFFKLGLLKALSALMRVLGSYEQKSIWFEREGRGKIRNLITRFSNENISYCNLVEQIPDFPSESHWYAISNGLKDMGILSQTAHHAFYISWHLPERAASESNTNMA